MIRVRVAVIITKGEEILLAKHSKGGKEYWVLPGGGVEEGESITETAIREIKEETKLNVKIKKLVFISEALPPDKHRHVIDFSFTGEILSGEIKTGEEEILKDVKFFPVTALEEIQFYPCIGAELKEGFEKGFSEPVRYLGNKWK